MAEVMLHRTQASQVVPIYEQFIKRYPTVSTLAKAKRKTLHDVLYPLGLHWRIDLIPDMTSDLMVNFNGRVPREKEALLTLSGISEYIASAVCCFAWNQPQPLIDTNTVRVIGRLFGLEIKDSSRRNRCFRELIAGLVDPDEPRTYNYALLDLAEGVCMKKRQPDCFRCPVRKYCTYGTKVLANGSPAKGTGSQMAEVATQTLSMRIVCRLGFPFFLGSLIDHYIHEKFGRSFMPQGEQGSTFRPPQG